MLTVEKSKKSDVVSIIDIENSSFTSPWSPEQILGSEDKIYIAKEGGDVKGFICIETIADEVHILHMATHAGHRRRGVGRALIEKALSFPGSKYFLEVRESNVAAQKLYESYGFKVISKRKKYYQDNDETALIMELIK